MKYNGCSNSSSVDYTEKKEKKDFFNLNIRPGVSSSKFQTTSNYDGISEKTNFDRKTSFRIGAEFEFILPYNKNKWALFIEPTYQYYKADTEKIVNQGTLFQKTIVESVDYKSLDIPIGIRHYFFLNDRSKIFVNAAYIISTSFNSSYKQQYSEKRIQSGSNIALGAGYKYNDKFSVEFRLNTSRDILRNYMTWESNYDNMSLIFGYTVF